MGKLSTNDFPLILRVVFLAQVLIRKVIYSLQISLLHYGARKGSPDSEWFQKLEDLAESWVKQGLVLGGCQMKSFDSFNDYSQTVPNDTYTVAVSFILIRPGTKGLITVPLVSAEHSTCTWFAILTWIGSSRYGGYGGDGGDGGDDGVGKNKR